MFLFYACGAIVLYLPGLCLCESFYTLHPITARDYVVLELSKYSLGSLESLYENIATFINSIDFPVNLEQRS